MARLALRRARAVSRPWVSAGGGGGAGGAITFPSKVWGLYYFSFSQPYIRNIPEDVLNTATHLKLAIAQSGGAGTGNLSYGVPTGQTQAQHVADITAYKARGKHVLMAIGGSNDGGITITNSTQVTQAYNSIVGFVNTYGITGIDFDLEPSGSSWNQTSLTSLVQQLKTTYGSGFIIGLTVALYDPYTANWMALYNASPSSYDYMAPMLYDFVEAGDSRLNTVTTDKAAVMATNGIPQSKMVMGYMGRQDTTYPNSSPPQIAYDAYQYALANGYPNLRGAFVWEHYIENTQAYPLTRTLGESINTAASHGTYLVEPFTTASTGATPKHVVLGGNPTVGGGASIIGNKLDLGTGTTGGYSGADRISRRLSANSSTALSVSDIEVNVDFVYVSGEASFEVVLRGSPTAWDGGPTGYAFQLGNGNFKVTRGVNFVDTVLATTAFTYTTGTTYRARVRAKGSVLQGWLGTPTSMPATPQLSVTDATPITGPGFAFVSATGGAAAVSSHVQVDNVWATNGTDP